MTPHKCHVNRCETRVPETKLMCSKHWAMVPADLKDRVLLTYRAGQCSDRRPSVAWLKAAREALNHVSRLEGTFVEASS